MPEKKKRRRRGRYSFLLTFFVIAALVFSFILTGGLFFKIKEIRVEGAVAADPQELITLSGFSYGENIFLINKITAARAIIAKTPHVKGVRIKRELPGTVVMVVTEAAPAAAVAHRGVYWLFDAQGTLLESSPAPPKLPVVKGFGLLDPVPGTRIYPAFEDTAKPEPLLDLLQAMQAEGVWDKVGEIDVSLLSNVRFTYAGIYKVELGTPEMIPKKFQVMLQALEAENVSGRGPGTLYLAGVAEGGNARFIPEG